MSMNTSFQEEFAHVGECMNEDVKNEEIFLFTEREDKTYGISLKDKSNCPKHVTVPHTYKGKRVSAIESKAFRGTYRNKNTSLTSIVIPEGITCIGEDAFFECSSLVRVSLPESLTHIGDHAFFAC